jgi:hypothetical protein
MSRIRTTAAALSAAALIGTGGMTAAQAATSGSSSSPARPAHGHGGPLPSAKLVPPTRTATATARPRWNAAVARQLA